MGPSDTSPEAQRVLTDVFRRMPVGRKWLQLDELFRTLRVLHTAGVRHDNPRASDEEVHRDWLRRRFGDVGPVRQGVRAVNEPLEILRVLREVIGAFARLSVPYALGGSMASSVLGVQRSTQDADIAVEPFPGREDDLAACFGPDYYLSLPAVRDANRNRSSFNVIHTTSGFKVDVFVRQDRPFELSAMARRTAISLPDAPEQPVSFFSAEDVILFKLEWFRLGEGVSDRQWADVLGVLKVRADKLDFAYLEKWAAELGVQDLLARVRQEAGG
jgi:hypothetical protein